MTLLCDCAVLPNGARLAKRDDAARDSDGTAAAPSPLDVRSTPGTVFRGICARQNPAFCYVRQRESINALSGVFLFASDGWHPPSLVRFPRTTRQNNGKVTKTAP